MQRRGGRGPRGVIVFPNFISECGIVQFSFPLPQLEFGAATPPIDIKLVYIYENFLLIRSTVAPLRVCCRDL